LDVRNPPLDPRRSALYASFTVVDVKRLLPELEELLRVFPAHAERPRLLTMYDRDDEDRRDWDAFEAVVRAHKRKRLDMPIVLLERWHERTIHGSFRRFAYFVPSILAACLPEAADGGPWTSAASWVRDARSAEALYHATYGSKTPRGFKDDERQALRAFFGAAVRETEAGPRPNRARDALACARAFDAEPR